MRNIHETKIKYRRFLDGFNNSMVELQCCTCVKTNEVNDLLAAQTTTHKVDITTTGYLCSGEF